MAGVDFKAIASAVRSAIYGRDMRKAIADGFDGIGDLQVNVVTDKTLTKSDMAADSKIVGNRFEEIEDTIDAIIPGLTSQEKDLLLAYFSEQVDLHPELQDAYNAIYNLWKPEVTSVSFVNDTETIAKGMSIVLEPIILPEDARDKSGVWTIDPSFGIVSCTNGKVTGVSVGVATVTFTSNSGSKSASVTVNVVDTPYYTITKDLTNVKISNSAEGIMEGNAYYATLIPDDGYLITDVDVLMGSQNVTEEVYNQEDKTITIVSVTDNITIVATAREHIYYSVTNNLTNCVSNSKITELMEGSAYSATITRSDENKLLDYRVTMGDNDVTDEVASTNDEYKSIKILVPEVDGDIVITVASIDPTNLENISWNAVSRISKAGLASTYFEVGDTKSIRLNGTMKGVQFNNLSIDLYIIGIDHNSAKEGSNLIHFKLGKINGVQVALINQSDYNSEGAFCMNSSGLENGGWENSDMRLSILGNNKSPMQQTTGTFMSLLPEDLRAVMRKASKYTYGAASLPTVVEDYVSLLNEIEYIGHSDLGLDQDITDNVQYEYYSSGNSINHYSHVSTSTIVKAWTRSVNKAPNEKFLAVSDTSSMDMASIEPNRSLGIAPVIYV